jgi:hypothetical protein
MSSVDTRVETTFTHTITLDEAEQFETKRRWSVTTLSVRTIVVDVTTHDHTDEPPDVRIRALGPRVLKNGVGQILTESWSSYGQRMLGDVPEPVLAAVRPYVNLAILGIEV